MHVDTEDYRVTLQDIITRATRVFRVDSLSKVLKIVEMSQLSISYTWDDIAREMANMDANNINLELTEVHYTVV